MRYCALASPYFVNTLTIIVLMIKNIDKIHPLKRDKVLRGMEFISQCCKNANYVDKVIVFGSSVRDDCTDESDIDILLFTEYTCANRGYFNIRSTIMDIIDDKCDIFESDLCNDTFIQRVIATGVVVFEFKN